MSAQHPTPQRTVPGPAPTWAHQPARFAFVVVAVIRSTIYVYRFPLRLSMSARARNHPVSLGDVMSSWPLVRQLREADPLGLGKAAQSRRSKELRPRLEAAEHVVQSVCPYCAVGCSQLVYVKDGDVS